MGLAGAQNDSKAVSSTVLVCADLDVAVRLDSSDYSVSFSVDGELAFLSTILILVKTRQIDTRQGLVSDLPVY